MVFFPASKIREKTAKVNNSTPRLKLKNLVNIKTQGGEM